MRIFALMAFLLVLGAPGAGEAQSSDPNLAVVPNGDAAMVEAVAKARATLPAFLELSRHPKPGMSRFAVKVGLGPRGGQEFFWLDPFTVTDGQVTGMLANDPEVIEGYRRGQSVTVPLAAVSDWMYVEDGRLRGNYTACALLAREGPAVVAGFERRYGADCSAL